MKKLFVLILASLLMFGGCTDSRSVAAEAEYPKMRPYSDQMDSDGIEYKLWREEREKLREGQYDGYEEGMEPFVRKTAAAVLGNAEDENRLYSPLNLYFALAMFAEITGGNSRTQILDVLKIENAEILRQKIPALWTANYCTDGTMNSIFANSLWLDRSVNFRTETLDCLAETYYASSYTGDMGSPEFTQNFRDWLNEQTGGLLKKQTETLEFSENSLLALASTVYYSAEWQYPFNEKFTEERIFHAPSGDIVCDFLYKQSETNYYYGENYAAVSLPFSGNVNSRMWFILPDEDISVTELLNDGEVSALYLTGKGTSADRIVHLRIPKFDVSSDIELSDTLKNLGITDVFDPASADFSPLTEDFEGEIEVDYAKHAVRVAIDEEGCTAAAYTAISYTGAAMPPDEEVEITFDRPFLFVITGSRNTVLFMGIVNNPAEN